MNVLFLCTGNSARSLIAEAVLNARSRGVHRVFSAGSRPANKPHPVAIRTLEGAGYATANLRSKSWGEYSEDGVENLDVVITLGDSAAAEECPVWIGALRTIHWGLPDPAAIENPAECERPFNRIVAMIEQRIEEFLQA